MPYLGFLENKSKKILQYLPSVPSKWKVPCTGNFNLGTKMPSLDWDLEKLLSHLKSAPSNLSNFEILWKN